MNDYTISSINDVVLVTLSNVPNSTAALADIFKAIGEFQINVDMICQTAPYKDTTEISFTIDQTDLTKTLAVIGQIKESCDNLFTEISTGNCKFIIHSELLKTQSGIAARLFNVMAENGLQIKLITTSDVEISILLDSSEFDKVEDVLKKEFQ
jgi:aspartokinase